MSADRKPLHPLGHASYLIMLAGYVAWAWTGEWRWGLTGFLVFLAVAALGGHLKGRTSVSITKAQAALQHLADGNKASARLALEGLSTDELWAICNAAGGLSDLSADLFGERAHEQATDEGRRP